MNNFDVLDEENFLLFAAKSYYNPRCSDIDDFYEDLYRIKYIKRLVNRYHESEKISERLVMNHIIVFCNSFSISAAIRIFEYRFNKKDWEVIKPFLVFLKYSKPTDFPDIQSDERITALLGKI
jgi:hypothetical protein